MPKSSGGGGSGGRSGRGGGGESTKVLMMGGVAIKKGLSASQIDDVMNASGASGGTPEYKAHMTKVAAAFKAAGIKPEDYEPESRGRGKVERLLRHHG